jgi:hypothetical protein
MNQLTGIELCPQDKSYSYKVMRGYNILLLGVCFFFLSASINKYPLYYNENLQVTCGKSKSSYIVMKSNLLVRVDSGRGTTGVKWHNDGMDASSLTVCFSG